MSTLTCITEKSESRGKSKGDEFRWKENMNIFLGGEKMKTASVHQDKN